MYYFALLKNTKTVHVFRSKTKPNLESHGMLYNLVYGGYKTRKEANLKANYQYVYSNIVNLDMRTKESHTNLNLYAIANIG